MPDMVDREELSREIGITVTSAILAAMEKHNVMHTELLATSHRLHNQLSLATEKLNQVSYATDSHEKILRGNGKVGLVTRMETMESTINRTEKLATRIDENVHEIERTLHGEKNHPGVIGRLTELERRADNVSKPLWIMLTALISTGITILVTHFLK